MKLNERGLEAAYASAGPQRDKNTIAVTVRAYLDAADWADRYIDRLNDLCERHGCPPGSDRLEWLDQQLSHRPTPSWTDDDRPGGFDGPTGAD